MIKQPDCNIKMDFDRMMATFNKLITDIKQFNIYHTVNCFLCQQLLFTDSNSSLRRWVCWHSLESELLFELSQCPLPLRTLSHLLLVQQDNVWRAWANVCSTNCSFFVSMSFIVYITYGGSQTVATLVTWGKQEDFPVVASGRGWRENRYWENQNHSFGH